jgi:hypothetical protein
MKICLAKKETITPLHSSRLYQPENDFVRNQHVDVDRNSNKSHFQILPRLAGY